MRINRASPAVEVDGDGFDLVVQRLDGDVIVFLQGEIDIATPSLLWERFAEAFPSVNHRLVLDLHDLAFIDSTGLSVLVRTFRRLRHAGAELVLRSPRTARKVLHVSGLDRVMTIEEA